MVGRGLRAPKPAEDELLSGPAAVSFSFGDERPGTADDDESEIIPDEVYGPLPSAAGVQAPGPASPRPSTGPSTTGERGVRGPVRPGPSATPRRIGRVETRTRVLQQPAHWEGAGAPPTPERTDGRAPVAARRGVFVAAMLALMTGIALVALLLYAGRIDEVLAGLEAGTLDRTEGPTHRAEEAGVAAPAPSEGLAAAPDEIVVELKAAQAEFHQIKAACPRESREHFIARFAGGVARLEGLPVGGSCQVDLEGRQALVIGEHRPGIVLACRPSGREANCGS